MFLSRLTHSQCQVTPSDNNINCVANGRVKKQSANYRKNRNCSVWIEDLCLAVLNPVPNPITPKDNCKQRNDRQICSPLNVFLAFHVEARTMPNSYSAAETPDIAGRSRLGFDCVSADGCCRWRIYDPESIPGKGCVRVCQPDAQLVGGGGCDGRAQSSVNREFVAAAGRKQAPNCAVLPGGHIRTVPRNRPPFGAPACSRLCTSIPAKRLESNNRVRSSLVVSRSQTGAPGGSANATSRAGAGQYSSGMMVRLNGFNGRAWRIWRSAAV